MKSRFSTALLAMLVVLTGCKDPKNNPSVENDAPIQLQGGVPADTLVLTPEKNNSEQNLKTETQLDGTVITTSYDPKTGITTTTIQPPASHPGGTKNTRTGPDARSTGSTTPQGNVGTTTYICTSETDCPMPEDATSGNESQACKDGACPSFVFTYETQEGAHEHLVYQPPHVKVQVAKNQLKGYAGSNNNAYIWERYWIGYDLEKEVLTFYAQMKKDLPDLEGEGGSSAPRDPSVPTFQYDSTRCDASRVASDQPEGFFIRFHCNGDRDFDGELFVPEKNILPTSNPVR